MIEPWVLIFVNLSGFVPIWSAQPIYFWNKDACHAVALELNNGPEPTRAAPSVPTKNQVGAVCRFMGSNKPPDFLLAK